MDHATYLDRYEALTSAAMSELALLHGRGDWEAATTYLTGLRAAQDALWEAYRASASQQVKP